MNEHEGIIGADGELDKNCECWDVRLVGSSELKDD